MILGPDGKPVNTIEDSSIQELQREKLRAQIRDLSRPWWRRPEYIAPPATALVAVAALTVAVLSGIFDRERRLLEVSLDEREAQLAVAESELDERRHQLRDRERELEEARYSLATAESEFGAQSASMRTQLQSLESNKAEIERQNDDLLARSSQLSEALVQNAKDRADLLVSFETVQKQLQDAERYIDRVASERGEYLRRLFAPDSIYVSIDSRLMYLHLGAVEDAIELWNAHCGPKFFLVAPPDEGIVQIKFGDVLRGDDALLSVTIQRHTTEFGSAEVVLDEGLAGPNDYDVARLVAHGLGIVLGLRPSTQNPESIMARSPMARSPMARSPISSMKRPLALSDEDLQELELLFLTQTQNENL